MIIMVTMEPLSICEKCGSVRSKVHEYERVRYRCNVCKTKAQKEFRKQNPAPINSGKTDVYWACTKWLRDRGIDDNDEGFGDYKQ